MQPLDDFYYFAKVIEHGGYAKAARALDIPKSRLSRHVAALESRLGVRLVNRSTRRPGKDQVLLLPGAPSLAALEGLPVLVGS